MPDPSERRRALLQFLILAALALAWRLLLCGRYYGWEESDYGNVMMVRKVLESGFRWFPPQHMPGFYGMGALVRLLWDAPRGSALLMTMSLSVLNVGMVALVARKLVSPSAAWLVGLWMVFQPESALYGATQLRYSVFPAVAFASLAFLYWGGRDRGFGLGGLAFLVRMEAFFSLFPAALWAWWRDAGRGLRSLAVPMGLLLGVTAGWQLYITVGHGDPFFVWAVLDINRAPDVHGGELGGFDWRGWFDQAFHAVWWQLTWAVPRKIGWTWLLLAAVGTATLWRGSGRPGGRSVVAFGLLSLGMFVGTVFLSHHDANHNLYWAWLNHSMPFLALLAAGGVGWLERRLRPGPAALRPLALGLILVSAVPAFVHETRYQMTRSSSWYRPQLELSTWLEEETPPDTGVLVSSIPLVWLQRQPSDLRIYSWWNLPDLLEDPTPEEFGQFLVDHRIDYVMWFVEEWNESARMAPWMVTGQNMTAGPVGFTAVDREDGYGWILYLVTRPGHPYPPVPPAYGQGVRGRGWEGVP